MRERTRRSGILIKISWVGPLFNKQQQGKVAICSHPFTINESLEDLSFLYFIHHKNVSPKLHFSCQPPHAAFSVQQRRSHLQGRSQALRDLDHCFILPTSLLLLLCSSLPSSQGINIYSLIKFCSQLSQGWGEGPGHTWLWTKHNFEQ